MADHFSLMDKYLKEEGQVLLNGVQALVRLPLEQMRSDHKAGLRTGMYISGYQGSPLGELDKHLKGIEKELIRHNIIWQAGINEDVAATAVYGSQMLHMFPHAKTEAVVGMWYGKTPGLDRSSDAFRHGTFMGAAPKGGYLALVGDDPACKSSTLPGDSTLALYDLVMPTLFPSGSRETLEYGLHAIAMSRYSGTWGALKVVTNVADGGEIINVEPQLVTPIIPKLEIHGRPFAHVQDPRLIPPYSVELERHLHSERLVAAMAYVRANRLDKITVQSSADTIGLVASGKTYRDLIHTLDWLGLNEQALKQAGIRLYKLAMIAPIESEGLKHFAAGLDDVVVIEEKRGFIETQMRSALYNQPKRPHIWGKFDERDAPMFPTHGELSLESIGVPLAGFLARKLGREDLLTRVERLVDIQGRRYEPMRVRTPFFCSGCPHNSSTVRDGDELVGGGIGCHSMAVYMDRGVAWLTQMGGEGAPWMGISPFTEQSHILQNIGDGTFFHSGSKSLEGCISAGVDVTFRILYNRTVAMTGGQDVEGGLTPPALAQKLAAEGVQKVCIVTENLENYQGTALGPNITLHPKSAYLDVLKNIRKVGGVSVIIYDQQCAAEKRRMRKRGRLSTPPKRVYINQSVCEGCGDCGVRSNCLSVLPVETDYGRKTRIHLPSCNLDYTCLQGDCPAFMTVELTGDASPAKQSETPMAPAQGLKAPASSVAENSPYKILLVGVGGTGVVTVNALLSTAAAIEEKQLTFLDQTGLSQKGGAVLSNLVISHQPIRHSNKIAAGETDLLLGFDLLASVSPDNLSRYSPERTRAVVNTHTLHTGESVINIHAAHPQQKAMLNRLASYTRKKDNVLVDALAICEALFGDSMPGNVFMLGIAWQLGHLPLEHKSIEKAITLNGVAVKTNLNAFRWGRWFVQNPQKVMQTAFGPSPSPEAFDQAKERLARFAAYLVPAWQNLLAQIPDKGALRTIAAPRLADLLMYQGNTHLADQYVNHVKRVAQGEMQTLQSSALTEAFARWYFKLLAVKDEYETARLWLQDTVWERAKADYHGKVKRYVHLHPPALKRLGVKTKMRFGKSSQYLFRALYAMRFLRGSILDMFNSKHRRLERSLAGWYCDLVLGLLPKLTPKNYAVALKMACLPDGIRGYEDIKERNIAKAKTQAKTLLQAFLAPPMPQREAG